MMACTKTQSFVTSIGTYPKCTYKQSLIIRLTKQTNYCQDMCRLSCAVLSCLRCNNVVNKEYYSCSCCYTASKGFVKIKSIHASWLFRQIVNNSIVNLIENSKLVSKWVGKIRNLNWLNGYLDNTLLTDVLHN